MDCSCGFAAILSALAQTCSVATSISPYYDANALQPLTKSNTSAKEFDPALEEKQDMEVVGVVANIAQLITLACNVAQEAYSLYHTVKWFPRDVKIITDEMTAFSNLLEALQGRVRQLRTIIEEESRGSRNDGEENSTDNHNVSRSVLLSQFAASLEACRGIMLEIQDILSPSDFRDCIWVTKKIKALKWHLKTPTLHKVLKKLERHKSTLQTQMTALDGSVADFIFKS
jgi:hypothetical protein